MDRSLKSIVTRSKTQKINNTDANIKLEKNQQSKKKRKSPNIKSNLEISIKESPKEELFKAKKRIDESIKKKGSRRKLKLTEKMEISSEFITQDLNTNLNESVVKLGLKDIIKDKNSSDQVKKHTKSNNSLLNNSKALEKNKTPNKKLKWKIVLTGAKISPSMITPKSTPPKLSLTPHRSKKTPKKSPISLGSPKTHTKSVPRLLKSPRKLSLSIISGAETTDKSKTRKKKLKKTQKDSLKESSISEKDLSISSVEKNTHKKSSINLKPKVRKFSKQSKSQKSKKLKSPKLKLSSSYVEKDSSKMSIATPNSTLDLDSISSPKNKTSSIKHRLLNSKVMKLMTLSQIKDVLAEPIVLLKKLSPEDISSILTNSRGKSNISIKVKSSINLNIKSVDLGDSDSKLKHNHAKKSRNKMSSKVKDNTLIQKEKESIISSTPREEKVPLMDMNLICDTPMIDTSLNSRSNRSHSRTRLSDIMDKSTIITDISQPSLMNKSISDASQSYFSNDMTQQISCNENATTKLVKEQENEKNSTYELEKPQTLKLQRMIRKRTSTDANLITPTIDNKKSKVHFMNESNSKSMNWSASRSNILHNNIQRNSMNSSYKLKQIKTPKYHQNSSIPTLKTKSTSLKNEFIPIVRVNMIQNTPKTFESISKKSEKKSSVKKKPNFAKIHERMFAKSESLVDAKKRLEDRHIAFSVNKVVPKVEEERKKNVKKETNKPLPTDITNNGTHNRFGYRLRKTEAIKVMSTKQPAFSRSKQQKEMQMTLKGIRMNRRFELQMKFRNLNT